MDFFISQIIRNLPIQSNYIFQFVFSLSFFVNLPYSISVNIKQSIFQLALKIQDNQDQMQEHQNQIQENENPAGGLVDGGRRNIYNAGRCEQMMKNSKIVKVLIYFCLSVLIWIILSIWFESWIKQRAIMKMGKRYMKDEVVQLAGPDQASSRSYLYYRKIVELAKQNVKNNRKYKEGDKKFNQIQFQQLYQLFKVIKMIEKANQYTSQFIPPIETIQQTIINTPVNLTHLFSPSVDQFQCASCYSFPITATIEALYKKQKNITIKLSEQQIIDCAKDQKENGCKDGNITRGFQYAVNNGLLQEKDYPYRSISGNSYGCRMKTEEQIKKNKVYKISSYKRLRQNDCQAIKASLQEGIPVAVMINAVKLNHLKKGEVYQDCTLQPLNHAVTIVGINQKQDWIVRNSWGDTFGQNGYFLMKAGKRCGTCRFAIVPSLEKQNKEQQ